MNEAVVNGQGFNGGNSTVPIGTIFWRTPAQGYLPWPGLIPAPLRHEQYEFRLVTAAGRTQGVVTSLTMILDVPDLVETFSNQLIGASGTRLPITKTYRAIKAVNLTLFNDGGTAVRLEVVDHNTLLGPLVQAKDSAGSLTTAHCNADVQGY